MPHLHQLRSDLQLGSSEAIKQAAVQGLGLTCLSRCAVLDMIAMKRLLVLNTTLPRLSRRFYLIHHRQKHFSANLARFVAHCSAP